MPERSSALLIFTCAALLVLPTLAARGDDALFVSTISWDSIYEVDLVSGAVTRIVSGLDRPEDGACHPDGRIYFAESTSNRVTSWEQDGSTALNIIPQRVS